MAGTQRVFGYDWNAVSGMAICCASAILSMTCISCGESGPADNLVFECNPEGDDCGLDARCVLAGTRYVCSPIDGCPGGCKTPAVCVAGECRCFAGCGDRVCGSDGCGGSCGDCPTGESWWCDDGVCKDDCEGMKCGQSPELSVTCGSCPDGASWWCDRGKCVDDCDGLECGDSPSGITSCGTCQDGWWCDSGTCVDDCLGRECGTSPLLGVSCGECQERYWCDSGTCREDCGSAVCGMSLHGASCGTCPAGYWCDASGDCLDDCLGLECGQSPHENVICGYCKSSDWCNQGSCENDCDGLECGASPHGRYCGSCIQGATWWCNSGTCENDCDGLKCGKSPSAGFVCGTCQSRYWCNSGLCEEDCGALECGTSPHGVYCGSCQSRYWCNSGVCKDDCGALECGTSPHGVYCGACRSGWWCDSGTCKDDCVGLECGTSPHLGSTCGTCPDRYWCNAGTCQDDCGSAECGTTIHMYNCGSCNAGYRCKVGECVEGNMMIKVPSGYFWMGGNPDDVQSDPDEDPYHKVYLSTYYIDETEVTQLAYKPCVDAGVCEKPSSDYYPTISPNKPMVEVTWYMAKDYCEWAGKRLPTEAEWEKAARGTDGRIYPWGNDTPNCGLALSTRCEGAPQDVCTRSPAGDSFYGLCDMAGNVEEWVADWYDGAYYQVSPGSNPHGPGSGSKKVVRGGRYIHFDGLDPYNWDMLRTSKRWLWNPDESHYLRGFRCAK